MNFTERYASEREAHWTQHIPVIPEIARGVGHAVRQVGHDLANDWSSLAHPEQHLHSPSAIDPSSGYDWTNMVKDPHETWGQQMEEMKSTEYPSTGHQIKSLLELGGVAVPTGLGLAKSVQVGLQKLTDRLVPKSTIIRDPSKRFTSAKSTEPVVFKTCKKCSNSVPSSTLVNGACQDNCEASKARQRLRAVNNTTW